MKRFIATTALALVLATPAYVAAENAKPFKTVEQSQRGDMYASKLIGMRIYATEADLDEYSFGEEADWDDIGEVDDVILTKNGKVKAVILGIGGFLGIGERDIAVKLSSLNMVRESDDDDDFFLVVNANKEKLMNATAYQRKQTTASKKTDKKREMTAEEPKNEDVRLKPPAVERDGYKNASAKALTAEMIQGATVYGPNDEEVGTVDTLLMTDDGQLDRVVIDVGGFLGVGERQVATAMDELQILRKDGGEEVLIFIDSTKSELEKKPEYRS